MISVVTFMNEVNPLFGYLQVSAVANGLYPRILGYGMKAWWPDGLGAKINALRKFVLEEAAEQELILFLDAFDVMVFGDREEIVERFEALEKRTNRSLFFNAEKVCFPNFEDICKPEYPQSEFHRWRYLNSGAMIGRASAFKQMLFDPVDDVMPGSDQAFYQRYYLHFPERVGLDTHCEMLCATQGVGGTWGIDLQGRRLVNSITGTEPSVVHFVSNAHWAFWSEGAPTTVIDDMFRSLYPKESKQLFDVVEATFRVGGSHRSKLLTLRGPDRASYHAVMRWVLCFRCRLRGDHGDQDRECSYVGSLASGDMCSEVRWTFGSLALAVVLGLYCLRRRGFAPCLPRSLARIADEIPLARLADDLSQISKAQKEV